MTQPALTEPTPDQARMNGLGVIDVVKMLVSTTDKLDQRRGTIEKPKSADANKTLLARLKTVDAELQRSRSSERSLFSWHLERRIVVWRQRDELPAWLGSKIGNGLRRFEPGQLSIVLGSRLKKVLRCPTHSQGLPDQL